MALAFLVVPGSAGAGGAITPGLAAGGVPLSAGVEVVARILGAPSTELRDPTNQDVYIERWEQLCLGARYEPGGQLLALDVWFDVADACGDVGAQYSVQGQGGEPIGFRSRQDDVKRAFGYRPERVLRTPSFMVLVYDDVGVAFYIRRGGGRDGLVNTITVFPAHGSTRVWSPGAWGVP
jgi:hypothetical protein